MTAVLFHGKLRATWPATPISWSISTAPPVTSRAADLVIEVTGYTNGGSLQPLDLQLIEASLA